MNKRKHTCNASQNNNLCSFAKKTIVFVMFVFVSKCCNLKNKTIIKPKTKKARKRNNMITYSALFLGQTITLPS